MAAADQECFVYGVLPEQTRCPSGDWSGWASAIPSCHPSHLGGLWRGGAVGHPITTADLWEASDALPEELPNGTEGAGHSLNLT
jgi:hypothetical protein